MNRKAIAMNWYCFTKNREHWDAFARALASALGVYGIAAGPGRFLGDTHTLLSASVGLGVAAEPKRQSESHKPKAAGFALAYCCGIDAARFHPSVLPVASPVYRHSETPGFYKSVIVTNRDHLQDARAVPQAVLDGQLRLVINQPCSWSGSLVAKQEFKAASPQSTALIDALWSNLTKSGGHANSVRMVLEGKADVAYIDENSWQALQGETLLAEEYQGEARQGEARQGEALPGVEFQGEEFQDEARQGEEFQDEALPGKEVQGKARQGEALQGEEFQGKARQGETLPGIGGLRVIGTSRLMPACPFVIPQNDPELLDAVGQILASPKAHGLGPAMAAVGIERFYIAPPTHWLDPFAAAAKQLT